MNISNSPMDANHISEPHRQFLEHYASWPICFYTFKGKRVQPSFGNDDLLAVLLQHERFVCDSNSSWKEEAGKSSNLSKAFIIPHTALDEAEDVHGNLFGKKVKPSNENIFFVSAAPPQGKPIWLAIERYNSQFLKRLGPDKLKRASRERAKKSDAKYLESERERWAQVRREKENVLSVLEIADIENLAPVEDTDQRKSGIVQYVRSASPKCFMDYQCSMNVAGLCYAALLLERDNVGKNTRIEFSDPNRRNVLGDVLLLRDALWFKARILSNDGAVRRMAEYLALPEIKVTGVA
jgi:hypothetical protein